MAWISLSRTWATRRTTTTTSRKPLRCSSKILRWKRMYLLLRADQKLKQNHEDVLLLAHLQELFLSVKDLGLILSQKIIRLSLAKCQNKWVLFFDMVIYLEKKMERLSCGDWKIIFGTNLRTLNIGMMKCGRARCKGAEATRKYFNIVPTRQDKKYFISELFKVIQDAIPLILNCRTVYLFQTISSSTFITSDVTPSRIQDCYPGGRNFRQGQTVFFTSVDPTNKEHRDPNKNEMEAPRSCMVPSEKVEETWKHGVLGRHTTCSKERI